MDEFTRNRLEKIERATDISVIEMLKLAIDDIESGRTKCDGAVVVLAYRPENAAWEYEGLRAGLTYDQELVALDLAKDRCKRQWMNK